MLRFPLKSYLKLNADIFYWLFLGPFKHQCFKLDEVVNQMIRIGVEALPMAALTAMSVGLTLAVEGSHQFGKIGATGFVPDLVSLSLLKGIGPLLIGVIVIGRSGSAVTAELGTMKVSEEIEALNIMAINPIRFLIIPRFIAMLVMLPVLVVIGNYVGMFGGWLIAHFQLGMPTMTYITHCVHAPTLLDLATGLVKSMVFAWLIITIACDSGLNVTGGAEGVGLATTRSVAFSIMAILIANAILTAIFVYIVHD